jgi:hypothetical protein
LGNPIIISQVNLKEKKKKKIQIINFYQNTTIPDSAGDEYPIYQEMKDH